MYDELNQLYGFIYNNDKYYYIKNIFNTILGIVDSTGNDIVKYNYDAWGNILSVEDNSTDLIGSINPFRYKGYYYDSDIEMYYCKSRYYVPRWGRWLTPDNPRYFQIENINGLNLFVYCSNLPNLKIDPNGNDAIYVAVYDSDNGGLPIVGHSRLYYQDENGNWRCTEYTGTGFDKSTARVYDYPINMTTD